MALKHLTEAQKARMEEERIERMEELKRQNIFTNSAKNGTIQRDENTMNETVESSISNNTDDFFKTEELTGAGTPITGLEIDLPTFEVIPEGRYKFDITDVGIDNQVPTAFGVKNQVWLKYHLTSDNEEQNEYNVKQKYNISASNKSRFYETYTALKGVPPFGKINLKNLLGIKGGCGIKHIQMDNGDIFPKVVNINTKIYRDSSEVSEV